jgi:hypothetical protein
LKIFILKVSTSLQPNPQSFLYPPHNRDFGVEQDFLIWLEKNSQLITQDPNEADWHYLPVFWTRWHILYDFGNDLSALKLLQDECNKILIDDAKTFTITQFDGGTLMNLGKTLEFTAARTINKGIDIPILCDPHRMPVFPVRKKYIASFNGSFNTHPLRLEMKERFEENSDVLIQGGVGTPFYTRWIQGKQYNLNTIGSYLALCPRGTSCNSFRFFEAMQIGVAPVLFGNYDARPFKKFIDWDGISYFVSTIDDLVKLIETLDKKEAIKKGKLAFKYWQEELFYQKWCKYVIKELDGIK